MNGGGVQGLIDGGVGANGGEEIDSEDERNIEEEFKHIYDADEKLRQLLGDASALAQLSIKDKYQILAAYKKGGGVQGLIEEGEGGAEENSIIVHEGKKFKRVQIEGENQEYLMDEEGNIFDLEFNFIGQANGSDDEDAQQ